MKGQVQTLDAPRFVSPAMLRQVAKMKEHWHRELKLLRRRMAKA